MVYLYFLIVTTKNVHHAEYGADIDYRLIHMDYTMVFEQL